MIRELRVKNSYHCQGATISGGAVYDCFMGAGVPPFMGSLPLVALWGALLLSQLTTNYSLSKKVFRFPL